MSRRRELFPLDRGLEARMAVALFLNTVLIGAGVGLVVSLLLEGGWSIVVFLVGFFVAGALVKPGTILRGRLGTAQDHERVDGALRRLCFVADVGEPMVRLVPSELPLSWTVAGPWRRPQLSVTTGLLDRLADPELEAVVAHELSHVAHLDAVVMTVLAKPPIFILRGLRALWQDGLREKLSAITFGAFFAPPALALAGISRIVSRHRELAADRGAALLTGSPAAMASALVQLSDELSRAARTDLRSVAPRDLLHVLPAAREEPRGIRRLWATHPRLETRIAQLEDMEAALQQARPAGARAA